MDGATQVTTTDRTAINWSALAEGEPRIDWTLEEVRALYKAPFADLMHTAQLVHRQHFNPNQVQISTLLSVKTGGCPEAEVRICGACLSDPPAPAHSRPGGGISAPQSCWIPDIRSAGLPQHDPGVGDRSGMRRKCGLQLPATPLHSAGKSLPARADRSGNRCTDPCLPPHPGKARTATATGRPAVCQPAVAAQVDRRALHFDTANSI